MANNPILSVRTGLTQGLFGYIYSHETVVASSVHRYPSNRNGQVRKRNTEKHSILDHHDTVKTARATDLIDLCRP